MSLALYFIDGQLQGEIPPETIHLINDGDQLVCLLPGEEDLIPQQNLLIRSPDWLNFRLSMLQNSAYNNLAITAQSSAKTALTLQRLEQAFSVEQPHLEIIIMLWDALITAMEHKPTADEIMQWCDIANANQMLFYFNESGLIEALEQ